MFSNLQICSIRDPHIVKTKSQIRPYLSSNPISVVRLVSEEGHRQNWPSMVECLQWTPNCINTLFDIRLNTLDM